MSAPERSARGMRWPRLPWRADGKWLEFRLPEADDFVEWRFKQIEAVWACPALTDEARGHLLQAAKMAWQCEKGYGLCDGTGSFGGCERCRVEAEFIDALATQVTERDGRAA